MNKADFLAGLRKALQRLPQHEIDQSIAYYSEMIEDRIEDGMDEQQAVESLGNVNDIAIQIINESPIVPKAIAKAKTGSRALNIALLVLGLPIWLPLVLSFFAVVFAMYCVIWAVIISLWAVVFSLVLGGFASIVSSLVILLSAHPLSALLVIGVGFVCIGLGLLSFFGAYLASKGLFDLTKLFVRKIRSLFVREGSK